MRGRLLLIRAGRALQQARQGLVRRLPGKTPGSRMRNLLIYSTAAWACAILAEITLAGLGLPLFVAGSVFFGLALLWALTAVAAFGTVCLGVILLHSQARPVSSGRLLRDTSVSAVFTTAAFALLYRYIGLDGAGLDGAALDFGPCRALQERPSGPLDQLYYSLVTFSTLGYGELTLCRWRLVSAVQATLGNLHLGIFVGAAFYYLATPGRAEAGSTDNAVDQQRKRADRAEGEHHKGDVQ